MPVVAIFTKFDALEDIAYGKLKNEDVPHDDAIKQTADRALVDFERDYLPVLNELKYPPKGRVYLRGNISALLRLFTTTWANGEILDMNKPTTDCRQLIETIAAVLDNVSLRRLFVSTQRKNLELCMTFAVQK